MGSSQRMLKTSKSTLVVLSSRLKSRAAGFWRFRSTSSDVSSGVPYETQLKGGSESSQTELPSEADVVIIGGGSVGCNTLYHLTKLGVKNAVLLERDQLTSGTTWHTAGMYWNLRTNDVEIQLLRHGYDIVREELEKETGISTGWILNGGLFLASEKERMNEFKRMATIGKVFGIESFVLSPEETKELYPLLKTDHLCGSVYSPQDGSVDPAGLCTALTRASTNAGARVITNCSVTGIETRVDDFGTRRVSAVETERGSIKTPIIANCAGVWSANIGAMAQVNVPIMIMRNSYVVTEKVEGVQNMPNVREHDEAFYLKVQGDGLSVGGYEKNPIVVNKVPNNFAFSLYELDWDVFGRIIENSIKIMPKLETTGIKSTVSGPESFTVDHNPLLGEVPELRGFYLGCGFNAAGMMFGVGCGNQLARWIVNGRPQLDMHSYDIRRFPTSLVTNKRWLREGCHESYIKSYAMVFPHDEHLSKRNMKTSPLHEILQDAGCVFQERHGWERPGWFSPNGPAPVKGYDYYGFYGYSKHKNYEYYQKLKDDCTFDFPKNFNVLGKECLTTRENAAVFDMSYFGQFYLTGPDSQKAVDWIFSNDFSKPPGSTIYTCMLNKNGRVESDLTVSVIEPGDGSSVILPTFEGVGFYVAAGGGNSQQSYSHIQSVIQDQRFDCQLIDHSEDMGLISVQGPKSQEILQELTDNDLGANFPFSSHKIISIAGHKVRAIRLTFVGELGWELHIPNESCIPVYQAVMAQGQKFGICNAGYRAIDCLSIEKGYRHWHEDIRMDDSPLEGGLAFTCKLNSGVPFLGRKALEKQKSEGLKRKLACFTIEDHVPLHGLEAIWRNGVAVGFLRRGAYAYTLGKSIGYGYVTDPQGGVVNNEFLQKGEYQLESMGTVLPARIHIKSPFDPENRRIKGIYNESIDDIRAKPN